jgi:ribose transport system substrate-binding protein
MKDLMKKNLRFVIVPKIDHPWFDEVHEGALDQARLLKKQLRLNIQIDYLAPSSANPSEQNAILKKAAALRPDGIAIDPVDTLANLPEIGSVRDQGVPILFFDSPSPRPEITSVGNDFTEQGVIAADRLARLIGENGKVAVMQGVPAAPNHKERYEAQVAVLKLHPGITVVDGGIDNDNIQTASQEAAAVLAANPDLAGYLCCDASGPVGIAHAIKESNRVGKVKVVGMDGIKPILEAIKEGILDSSASTIPRLQGSMSILMLWQASLGVPLPRKIDTGILVITRENVDALLALAW